MASKQLRGKYNSVQLVRLLKARYGLNDLGIKCVLHIGTKRFNELKNYEALTEEEAFKVTNVFSELKNRLIYEEEEL